VNRHTGFAAGIIFIGALAIGFGLVVVGLTSDGLAVRGSAGSSSARALLDGTITAVADETVERAHPLRAAALAGLATVRYVVFSETLGEAVVGREGRLFTAEEFERHAGDDDRLRERVTEIIAVADVLRQRGARLVVVLIPSKARMLSAHLPPRWAARAEHGRSGVAVDLLRREEILVVDLSAVLMSTSGTEYFFARDTHWTPEGAAAAAEAIARAMEDAGALTEIERQVYRRELETIEPVPGDLMSFLPVGRLRRLLGLPEEQARVYRADAPGPATGLGLFDELTIPVSLVGTSYSRDPRWGFESALKAAIAADVLNVAAEGEGPFEPMRAYLAGPTIDDVPPALVIWEIPERYLTLPEPAAR
jgi:alginate O-acetyltransferase complex protein AlgJ